MVLGLRFQPTGDTIITTFDKRPGHLFEAALHVADVVKLKPVFNSWAVKLRLRDEGSVGPIGPTRCSVLLTDGARLIESTGRVLQTGERQIGIGCRNRNIMTEKCQFGDCFLAAPPPPGPAERVVFVLEAR